MSAPSPCLLRRLVTGVILATLLVPAVLVASPAAAQPDLALAARAGYADLSGGLYDEVYDGEVNPLGLAVEVRWPAFLLRLAAERAEADGELFIPVVPLPGTPVVPGQDVELTLDLYHLTAAYNAAAWGGAWSWFAGGGLTYAAAEEEAVGRRRDNSATGFHAVAGVRRALGPRWELGGEAMYYSLADLVELGGTQSDDLESLAATVSLGFRF